MVFFSAVFAQRWGTARTELGGSHSSWTGPWLLSTLPRQPVLRQNKLRIFRFRASAKAQSLRLFLLSPRSRLLRGDPIYGQTLCVQTGWAA